MRPDSGPLCTLRAKQPPEGRPALRPGRGAAVWDPGPCARRCPSAPDLRGEEAAGPSEGPPDGDVPGTAGQAPPLPFGLYLTGLEALRRSHSFSKGIWFRARVISQNPLAFDTPPPPRYPPPPFRFACYPSLRTTGRPCFVVSHSLVLRVFRLPLGSRCGLDSSAVTKDVFQATPACDGLFIVQGFVRR